MKIVRMLPLLVALITMLGGVTARAGIFDDEEARKQIAETRKRVDDVGRQLDSRIAELEGTIKSQGLLNLINAVEGLKSEIATLRGQIEVLHNDVETTQKRQRDLYVDLDTRMRKMETAQQQAAAAAAAAATAAAAAAIPAPGTVLPPPAGAAPVTTDIASAAPGPIVPGVTTPQGAATAAPTLASRSPNYAPDIAAEQRGYDAALDQFKSGNYSASLQSFVNFVKQYPRSPLAPSAQYWVGNAHYALRDYRSAIASQRQLIVAYPDSQKVPDALLNMSSSQIELGDTAGAKRTLEDLAQRYPASEAADRAKKRLAGARAGTDPIFREGPQSTPLVDQKMGSVPGFPKNVVCPRFSARVIEWQRRHGRHGLPWQNTRDPYRIWLSEIMLQQTQVSAVIPYYQRFVAAFPDLRSLADAPRERVLELWSGLGYYSRARNLHRCAQQIVRDHGGEFPADPERVAELPGIGRSTAAAICAFAFGARNAILDGNVKRVLARHAGIDGYPGERSVENRLWEVATSRLPDGAIEVYTQALMDLGATICIRSRPLCALCPIREDCIALATHRVDSLPAPRPKKELPQRAVTMLLLTRHESVLVERRPPSGIWGGLWSLPELPDGLSAERYCTTRFAAEVHAENPLRAIEHGFTHFRLTITPQPCRVVAWNDRAEEPGLLWLPLMDAKSAALPAPIKKMLSAIAAM